MLTNHSIFKKMDELGNLKIPFFFMIDFLKENAEVIPLDKMPLDIKFEIGCHSKKKLNKKIMFKKNPISFDDYYSKFSVVHKNLLLGNSYLTNLTTPTAIETNLSLDDIYNYCEAKFKLKYKEEFICFSPERFVKINQQKIFSYPMKGTINAEIENSDQLILNDEKESSEHATIVDLIRNDLSLVAKNVKVNRYRYLEEVETNEKKLLQVSSEISGDLATDYNSKLGTIFNSLLPAGSICGAPKSKTLQIIRDAEQYARKFYTGVFGVFDGENLDSAVMIRFIEQKGKQLFFKSGGGITAKSDVKSEYNELVDKVYVPIF